MEELPDGPLQSHELRIEPEDKDIKRTENYIRASNALLRLLAESDSRKEYLDGVVQHISKWSGCSKVGVRILDERGGIPYESYVGFSREFWESENWIVLNRDNCACTRVISGKFEPQDVVCVTPGGSFWCNDTLKFVGGLSEREQTRYRGTCIKSGFKTVTVVPVRHQQKVVGAIHLADEREDNLPLGVVESIESMTPLMGEAINKFNLKDELQRNFDIQRVLTSLLRLSLERIDLDQILLHTLDLVFSVPWMPLESVGSIYVVENDPEVLVLRAARGSPAEARDSNANIRIENLPQSCGHTGNNLQTGIAETRSFGRITVPVVSGDRIIGLMELHVEEGSFLSPQEAQLLVAVADALAGIIQRKQAENALEQSEQQFRMLVETMNEGLRVLDENGFITYANDKLCEMLGCSRDELIGRHVSHFYDTDNLPILEQQLAIRRAGERSSYEIELQTKNGRKVPAIVSASPVLDSDGTFRGVIGAITDTTFMKEAERNFRESEEKYRMIFERSPAGIVHFDRNGIITACNDNLARIIGSPKEEIIGRDLPSFLKDVEMEAAISLCLSGKPAHHETCDSPDASCALTAIKADYSPVLSEDGSVMGCIGIVEDITERKHAEHALRESEKQLRLLSARLLTAQEQERKRISREVHDSIGSSLTAIKFSLERTLEQMKNGMDVLDSIPTLISMSQRAIEEARRIMTDLRPSMLDDLGIVATIGWFRRHFQAIYPDISVESATELLEHEMPEDLKIVVFRIIQEAFHNIAKYSEAKQVHLTLAKTGKGIELAIEDNGVGFDLSLVTSRDYPDRGLGIASMKERTELSGGRFFIHSATTKGTTIRALWPSA